MTSPSLADIHTTIQKTRIRQELGTNCANSKMQIGKMVPNKGMNREMKATVKIGFVKTNLICVRVTSPFLITRDPIFTELGN